VSFQNILLFQSNSGILKPLLVESFGGSSEYCIVWFLFSVKNDCVNSILPILMRYKSTKEAGHLLCISFTSLIEYLWLLRAACDCLAPFGSRAVLYLAAAVSDFYIPSNQMVSM